MEPWQSWTVVAVAGVGVYWYYARQKNNRRRNGRPAVITEPLQSFRRKVENKNKRGKDSAVGNSNQTTSDAVEVASVNMSSSGGEQLKNRKGGKKKQPGELSKSSAVEVTTLDKPSIDSGSGGDDVDNKEFARQLASVKAGTPLHSTAKAAKPVKTKKQSQLNGSMHMAPDSTSSLSKDMSGTSSNTGAEADDDLSLPNSPDFGATPRDDIGVSDMLEAPAPGPSVLRLTESTQPQRSSAPKQSKAAQMEETKKQRQRKAKNEARKAELAQQEKERRVLLEKQLRTAREAEGRPAKNGVPVSASPASNAWSKSANGTAAGNTNSVAQVKEIGSSNGPLLDTFEQTSKVLPNGNLQNIGLKHDAQQLEGHPKLSDQNWPSEEEQMRMLDEESSWQTVNAKKRVTNKKEDGAVKIDEAGTTDHTAMGDAAARKTITPSKGDSAASRKANSTMKTNLATSTTHDGVVMGMKIDTSEADDGKATTGDTALTQAASNQSTSIPAASNQAASNQAVGDHSTVGFGNAQSEVHTKGSLSKGFDGTKIAAVDVQDPKGAVTVPLGKDITTTDASIVNSTTTSETIPTSEVAVPKGEEKPRKQKKGEHLPYIDKRHPGDSDWAVV